MYFPEEEHATTYDEYLGEKVRSDQPESDQAFWPTQQFQEKQKTRKVLNDTGNANAVSKSQYVDLAREHKACSPTNKYTVRKVRKEKTHSGYEDLRDVSAKTRYEPCLDPDLEYNC